MNSVDKDDDDGGCISGVTVVPANRDNGSRLRRVVEAVKVLIASGEFSDYHRLFRLLEKEMKKTSIINVRFHPKSPRKESVTTFVRRLTCWDLLMFSIKLCKH